MWTQTTQTHRIAVIKLLNIKNDRRDMISEETMGSCLTQKGEMTNQTMLKMNVHHGHGRLRLCVRLRVYAYTRAHLP